MRPSPPRDLRGEQAFVVTEVGNDAPFAIDHAGHPRQHARIPGSVQGMPEAGADHVQAVARSPGADLKRQEGFRGVALQGREEDRTGPCQGQDSRGLREVHVIAYHDPKHQPVGLKYWEVVAESQSLVLPFAASKLRFPVLPGDRAFGTGRPSGVKVPIFRRLCS